VREALPCLPRKAEFPPNFLILEAVPKLQFLGRQAKLVQQPMKGACCKITDFGTGSSLLKIFIKAGKKSARVIFPVIFCARTIVYPPVPQSKSATREILSGLS
jgi:hypothetical protein